MVNCYVLVEILRFNHFEWNRIQLNLFHCTLSSKFIRETHLFLLLRQCFKLKQIVQWNRAHKIIYSTLFYIRQIRVRAMGQEEEENFERETLLSAKYSFTLITCDPRKIVFLSSFSGIFQDTLFVCYTKYKILGWLQNNFFLSILFI